MMTTAFEHCAIDEAVPVDGVARRYELLAHHCRSFNLTGHPVVTIPIGFAAPVVIVNNIVDNEIPCP